MKKKLILLGSTGSIGRQTLQVVAANRDDFELIGLSAGSNTKLLIEQAKAFHPHAVASLAPLDPRELPEGTEYLAGEEGLMALAADKAADVVVLAISGIAALQPLLAAVKNGKRIAIANKESLVCGGDVVDAALNRSGAELVPIDSEQSAIFQCLQGGKREELQSLILTASGGPFWQEPLSSLENVPRERVFAHPTWSMGRKITLDSATLFNKGLEVIEAARLFHVSGEQIEVLIHPQSIVHSMVRFCDGTVLADLSLPDMRLPIQYALSYPKRLPFTGEALDLSKLGSLSFFRPDPARFGALPLAYAALKAGGGYPTVYNGANERAAQLYLAERIGFLDIERLVRAALDRYTGGRADDLESILLADQTARMLVDAAL